MQSKSPKHDFVGHRKTIRAFVFLHDNVHIVSGSDDGTMRKWDCETGLLVGKPWKGEGGSIRALALSPDGKMIVCGRQDGIVQRWDTDGEMIDGAWMRLSKGARLLSWSPSGSHIVSGTDDKRIQIRTAKSGKLELEVMNAKRDWVHSLEYSPSGDRIASGGWKGICIWDSNTGELLVGPIQDPGSWVTSIVWSSDGNKLYSTSDRLRVYDSISGTELYRFKRDVWMTSVALLPKYNVLACVGVGGVVQLWDTESHQRLAHQTSGKNLYWVSFSPDGRYLAYGGSDKITLWMVQDIVPPSRTGIQGDTQREALRIPESSLSDAAAHCEVRASTPMLQLEGATQQETRPDSPSSSYLDVDATRPFAQSVFDDINITGEHDDPYDNFFQSSLASSEASPDPSPNCRMRNISFISSVLRPLVDKSIPRLKRGLSATVMPRTAEQNKGKGKEQENVLTPPPDNPSPPIRKLCIPLIHTRGKSNTSRKMASAKMSCGTSPEVVEVCAARGFQRLVAYKRKCKMTHVPITTGHATSSQVHTSLQMMPGQAGISSQSMTGYVVQHSHLELARGPASHTSHSSPPHHVTMHDTNDDSDSDSNSDIKGFWNKFLDKICFPCGHYHEDM